MARGSAVGLQQLIRAQGIVWGDSDGHDKHLWIDGDTLYTDAVLAQGIWGQPMASTVIGDVAEGITDPRVPVGVGGVDSSGNRKELTVADTGGLQANLDTIDLGDDAINTMLVASYPSSQTSTAFAGGETSIAFAIDLRAASQAAVDAIQSATFAIETKNLGTTITSAKVTFTDVIGTTTIGPTYPLFNVPATAIATAPTFLIGDNSSGLVMLPRMDRGALKTASLTLTFAAGVTAGGTVKVQSKFNPYPLQVGPEYMVWANLQALGTVTDQTLCPSLGATTRLYLVSGRVTNGSVTTGVFVVLTSGAGGEVVDGGYASISSGFLLGPYPDGGIPLNAQARGLFVTTSAAGAIYVFVALRVGT